MTRKDLLLEDWITPGLSTEMRSLFPTSEQIDKSNGTQDLEGFKTNCLQLFPVGQSFAPHKQVEQAAKVFLDTWAISSSCIGKKVVCYYSKPPSHSKQLLTTPNCLYKDLKNHYDCPFVIHLNFIAYKINGKKPLTFYQVKITHLNAEHTCKLSTLYHRRALQKGGCLKMDLSKLQTILLLLCEKPQLDTRILQPG
jgi:hypothetical protein